MRGLEHKCVILNNMLLFVFINKTSTGKNIQVEITSLVIITISTYNYIKAPIII